MFKLKNIKVLRRRSNLTTAFTASLFQNHTKIAEVSNEGGPLNINYFLIDSAAVEEFKKYAASLPPYQTPDGLVPMDHEAFIISTVERRMLKAACVNKTLVRSPDGTIYVYDSVFTPSIRTVLQRLHPRAVFLNEILNTETEGN